MEHAGPVVRSLRFEVRCILTGCALDVGLEPASSPEWIGGFIAWTAAQTAARFDEDPGVIARRAGFRVHILSLGPAGAAASTVSDLWVPRASPRDEARLLVLHEFLHGMLLRRGDERCESDAWMATAAWVARAMLVPGGRGVTLFPEWFIHLTPRHFWV